MQDSLWFSTRSKLFEAGDGAWDEVARYASPLARFLGRRYPQLGADARDDLVQEVLLEIKEKLTRTYDPDRGKFRALLQSVVHRRVVDRLRALRAIASLEDEPPAPRSSDVDALDLETGILEAVAACHDHFSQGAQRDLDVVWVLGDILVGGLKSVDIARRDGITVRQVSHRLGRAREVIFRHLLARELELPHDSPLLAPAVDVFRRCLRNPRRTALLVEELEADPLGARLDALLQRFWASLDLFRGDGSAQGVELARGIRAIFEETPEGAAA